MNVWRLAWKVSQHEPRWFWAGWGLFVLFFVLPLGSGWSLSRAFDAMSNGDTDSVIVWVVVFAVFEVVRMAVLHAAVMVWTRVWMHMQTFLRANLLVAQVASGGPEAGQPVGSAGEAVTHFRDDAEDVAKLIDGLVDVSAGLVFSVAAVIVLGAANLAGAIVLIGPLLLVAVVTKAMDTRIKEYRMADRAATEAVTGFVGDIMAAATTVKVNAGAPAVIARLRVLVDRRRTTAVRDRVLEEGVHVFSRGAADAGLGLVLLVGAGALASGAFDVGELALFVAYLGWLSFLPRMFGRVLARKKQAGVAFDRMSELVAGQDVRNTVQPRDLPINTGQDRSRPVSEHPGRVVLRRLEVSGLTATYSSGRGVRDVSLAIDRGQLVVVTGPVGAGKSTLLRAVLGLAWQAENSGEVRWNGSVVDDRAAFLVPPNAAFLPQVPQLISDSLADNIAFGDGARLPVGEAIRMAAMEPDVAAMADGTDTVIGPRGLRLSGGQRQRLAGARAVVHQPELVVLDDLSSALDVETELQFWSNLAAAGMTVLAVSHRAVAFERADLVVRLEAGRVVAVDRSSGAGARLDP